MWLSAAAACASPRPFTRLLGLNSGRWPRGASENPLLPDHIISSRELDPLPQMDFGRIAAQSAKQVIMQKVREAERLRQYEEFKDRAGTIINGIVKREEYGNIIVDVGRGGPVPGVEAADLVLVEDPPACAGATAPPEGVSGVPRSRRK